MFCLRCGAQNADTAERCANCGEPMRQSQGQQGQQGQQYPQQSASASLPAAGLGNPRINQQGYNQQGYGGPGGYGAPQQGYQTAGVRRARRRVRCASECAQLSYMVDFPLPLLFCCLPVGIVAIVYASQVDGKLRSGDYEGAVKASNNAKTWTMVSAGLGLVVGIIYVIAAIAGGIELGGQAETRRGGRGARLARTLLAKL